MGLFRRIGVGASKSSHKLAKAVTGATDRITGKAVEERIDEYSEIYGEILVGMHRELQEHKSQVSEAVKEMRSLLDEARKISNELRAPYRPIRRAYSFAITSIVLSLLAIGASIWIYAFVR
jgi:hypothetical protein